MQEEETLRKPNYDAIKHNHDVFDYRKNQEEYSSLVNLPRINCGDLFISSQIITCTHNLKKTELNYPLEYLV